MSDWLRHLSRNKHRCSIINFHNLILAQRRNQLVILRGFSVLSGNKIELYSQVSYFLPRISTCDVDNICSIFLK